MKFLLRSICLLFLLVLVASCSQVNDFDMLCSYFDKLELEENIDKLMPQEKYKYINDLVESGLPISSDARISWQAIVNLNAEKRYFMFIEAAESSLKEPWQCNSMKNLIQDI